MNNTELKLSERQIKLLDGIEIYANENGEVVAWEANRESDYTEAGLKRTITILQDKGLIKIVSGSKTRAWTLMIALTEAGKEVIGANEELNLYKVEFEDENFEIISARNMAEASWQAETYVAEHGYIMEINQVDENYEPIDSEEEELLSDVDSEDIEDIWNTDIDLDLAEELDIDMTMDFEDEELKPSIKFEVNEEELKLMRERNKIWNELLDEVFCTTDEEGNRPCDNGCICDRCQASWFLEEYEKAVDKALHGGNSAPRTKQRTQCMRCNGTGWDANIDDDCPACNGMGWL